MASVIIDDINLTNIANAIREKNGSSETYKPSEMSAAISSLSSGSGGDDFSIDLTNKTNFKYWNYYGNWSEIINKYGNKIIFPQTADSLYQAFFGDKTSIDLSNLTLPVAANIRELFGSCSQLVKLPKFKNIDSLIVVEDFLGCFLQCNRLREIPNDFFTSKYSGMTDSADTGTLFGACYSLRELPDLSCFNDSSCNSQGMYVFYNTICNGCYALNKIINLPVITKRNLTSASFRSAFNNCWRINNMTFATQADGAPYTANWKSQTLDFSQYVGYAETNNSFQLFSWNSGLPDGKEIIDDTTYQTLKNDPDSWTKNVAYSRYNHTSAVATINSLPDTSAYLATQSGATNTIKFKGEAGSLTDGGAISNLTEEEIAVAAAKGWTVSLI